MIGILYAATSLLSAGLLFIVQPLFARMVLPLLGGSPAVWNTALVFYQAVLLLGYTYAHLITRRLSFRRQIILHGLVLLLPLVVLPIRLPEGWTPPTTHSPVLWLMALFGVAVGLPFFVVSTSSPLLQKWFAGMGRAGADPYYLYAASNLGSMVGLLSYPFLVEPSLHLMQQSSLWAVGYLVLIVLLGSCGVLLWRAHRVNEMVEATPVSQAGQPETLTLWRRLRWLLLAFVPSSLMLSVTSYISTDVAAIPLLWVVPLALYLMTFILVFARRPIPHWIMIELLPIMLLPMVVVLASHAVQTTIMLIPIHLVTFFIVAMVCHGELAQDRPQPQQLTEFYLWMSLGGVLGGGFNALVAPLLFSSVVEYPLTLVLACLLLPNRAPVADEDGTSPSGNSVRAEAESKRQRLLDGALPVGLLVLVAGLVWFVQQREELTGSIQIGLMFGVPALICFSFAKRPIRFGLGVGAILLASMLYMGGAGRIIYAERTFFGIHRVGLDDTGQYHVLYHGSTIHGMQSLDPARRTELLTYYSPSGPLGQIFTTFDEALVEHNIAVVGLGAGSVVCHKQPDQHWTFYEIDPSVERIARDPRFFTYLQDCAPDAEVILGDGRLFLASAPPNHYGLMILDAYSSDAMPVHLLTREAIQVYLAKLAPGGLLAFNVSNRYFDLKPVLANLAQDAGLIIRAKDDLDVSELQLQQGKIGSQWVLLVRQVEDLGPLANDPRWFTPQPKPGTRVWTDDYSSLFSALYD
jgi:hypothetical protein